MMGEKANDEVITHRAGVVPRAYATLMLEKARRNLGTGLGMWLRHTKWQLNVMYNLNSLIAT